MDSRRGLELWGPVGRWVFLNWPRGSWQYDLICGVIIAGLFLLPGPQGQGADLDTVLAQVRRVDAALRSFTADMSATERLVLFNDESTESGTVAFMKPAFIRREIAEPNRRTELIADNLATVYIPRVKQATIYPIEGAAADGPDLDIPGLASMANIEESFDVSLRGGSTDEADGARLYVLRLVPKAGTAAAKRYKTIELSVAEGEWHPARRIVLEEHSGNINTIVLSNVKRNPGLDRDDFELDLPKGTEIVDHRGGRGESTLLFH